MNKQRFTSVWDAIEDTPEQAANMKLRSILMIALKDHITRTGMSQAQAAQLFGVTQPRVSDLMRGKINLFFRKPLRFEENNALSIVLDKHKWTRTEILCMQEIWPNK